MKGGNIRKIKRSFFFFLTQQFITQYARADRGSDYVTIYMQNNLT